MDKTKSGSIELSIKDEDYNFGCKVTNKQIPDSEEMTSEIGTIKKRINPEKISFLKKEIQNSLIIFDTSCCAIKSYTFDFVDFSKSYNVWFGIGFDNLILEIQPNSLAPSVPSVKI